MTTLREAAQQALEALEGWDNYGKWVWPESALEQAKRNTTEAITALRAALAQQAEPDHEPRAELAEQQVVQLAEERDHYRNLWQKAQQAEPQNTHSTECWRWHHKCAVAKIERECKHD